MGVLPAALASIGGLRKLREECVVYFLCYRGEVVYVGQSKQLGARVIAHKKGPEKKKFDAVFYVSVPHDKLNRVEADYIRLLDPPLNRAMTGRSTDAEAIKRRVDTLRKNNASRKAAFRAKALEYFLGVPAVS